VEQQNLDGLKIAVLQRALYLDLSSDGQLVNLHLQLRQVVMSGNMERTTAAVRYDQMQQYHSALCDKWPAVSVV
jgi:hypothetical protein